MSQREEFMELLFKQAAGQSSAAEQARIEEILAQDPGLSVEFEQWQRELPALQESIQLVAAEHSLSKPMPDHVRTALLGKVRDRFGLIGVEEKPVSEGVQDYTAPAQQELAWHWALIPATGLAAVFAIALNLLNQSVEPASSPSLAKGNPELKKSAGSPSTPNPPAPSKEPVIQLALLDVVGVTRGAADETRLHLKAGWQDLELSDFESSAAVRNWLADWPEKNDTPVIKILFHHSSGELKVVGRINGSEQIESFVLNDRSELPGLILKAQDTIDNWLEE